jgi:hypothetical protein
MEERWQGDARFASLWGKRSRSKAKRARRSAWSGDQQDARLNALSRGILAQTPQRAMRYERRALLRG